MGGYGCKRPLSNSRAFWTVFFSIVFLLFSPCYPQAGMTFPGASISKSESFSRFSRQDLKMLGVVAPSGDMIVQDSYKGIEFLSSPTRRYTEAQLALLKYFIDRTPALLLKYGPSAIVNAHARGHLPTSVAQASGPYIYFDSRAFHTGGFWSASSLEEVFRGFIHELTHVLQFRKGVWLIDLGKAREKFRRNKIQTHWDFAVMKTKLIGSFADVTGWELNRGIITTAHLKDFEHEDTSSYGRTSIIEDMAETVSFVVVGDLIPLSKERIQWTVKLLGYPSLKEVLYHTFPYLDVLEPVSMRSSGTRFDVSKKKAYEKRYRITDIAHFVSKGKSHYSEIVLALKQGFRDRGWENTLSKELRLKHNVKKYILEYRGKWRDIYLEVISYEEAIGYLLKPDKTIITVLSGYHR